MEMVNVHFIYQLILYANYKFIFICIIIQGEMIGFAPLKTFQSELFFRRFSAFSLR